MNNKMQFKNRIKKDEKEDLKKKIVWKKISTKRVKEIRIKEVQQHVEQ